MITITASSCEKKVSGLLAQLLKEKGYLISGSVGNGVIHAHKDDDAVSIDSLEEKIIEMEGLLYEEKRGAIYKAILEKIERPLIERALKRTDGNQLKAARILGINRNTMRVKIKRLGINAGKWKIA
ncbi:MAG: hypothetical protein NTY76_03615 [Candidatus Omnitrophica bacterium]|nr:hypothetical protein [Candidatus Omnitrophota bacterium]